MPRDKKTFRSLKKIIKRNLSNLKGQNITWIFLFICYEIIFSLEKTGIKLNQIDSIKKALLKHDKGRGNQPQTITFSEALILAHEHDYYKNRWPYFDAVIQILREEAPEKVLELGPYLTPIVKGSDTMDIRKNNPQLTYLHDAKVTPFPIADRSYDIFIGLQVWEHLDGRQREAFREVMRISKSAILSFPYKWNRPGNHHHNIDEAIIAEWTLNTKPERIIRIEKRIIYFFKFKNESFKKIG